MGFGFPVDFGHEPRGELEAAEKGVGFRALDAAFGHGAQDFAYGNEEVVFAVEQREFQGGCG